MTPNQRQKQISIVSRIIEHHAKAKRKFEHKFDNTPQKNLNPGLSEEDLKYIHECYWFNEWTEQLNKLKKGIEMNDVNNNQVAAEQILGIPQAQGLPTKETSVFTQSQEQVGDESEVAA